MIRDKPSWSSKHRSNPYPKHHPRANHRHAASDRLIIKNSRTPPIAIGKKKKQSNLTSQSYQQFSSLSYTSTHNPLNPSSPRTPIRWENENDSDNDSKTVSSHESYSNSHSSETCFNENESIARDDIEDDLIPSYLLQFERQEWDFNNDCVDVYRSQAARIDHKSMCAHPNDTVFPEFFSNDPIPKKECYVATILPPSDFNIHSQSWKMSIHIASTTAGDIISKFVHKINNMHTAKRKKKGLFAPQEFVLKVTGNEEYILFDHAKLIMYYEAVRRAVRNEDDVSFNLIHRPDLNELIADARELQEDYKRTFDVKYPSKVRDKSFLKYEEYGAGDGQSLIELKLANMTIGEGPSSRDSAWLRKRIKERNRVNDFDVVLLEDYDEMYRFRIAELTNVSKLPRFGSHIRRVIIRHELWMGALSYDECVYNTRNIVTVSDRMRFGDWYRCDALSYCDLPREASISFTIYGLSPHEKRKSEVVETPLGYVRIPMIDHRHRLVKGTYVLNAWPIPVFTKTKHGLKSDPYSHGQEFRFRGATRDCYGSSCQMTIEFDKQREFDVVAPLMNKSRKKRSRHKRTIDDLSGEDWQRIHAVFTRDLLCDISSEEKSLMWRARDQLASMPDALCAFLRCIDWRDVVQRAETYEYLREWQSLQYPEDALELLSWHFSDTRVRECGVLVLANMHDSDLQRYLLQLIECLKFELHHNNALIRLLMRRALMNPYQIGHFLFWALFNEYSSDHLQYKERFGLYLEEYLLHSTSHSRELLQQSNLIARLELMNKKIIELKSKKDRMIRLHEMCESLNSSMPSIISLPLNPRLRCTHLVVQKCKFFSSAQVPLYLVFRNVDPLADDIQVLFKCGDDLRQDILTLQVFRVMDKVWLNRGLNLRLITYDVVATGNNCGMIQIVCAASTTNDIHLHKIPNVNKSAAQKACRDETTHLKWITEFNKSEDALAKARFNYARSCAGYCVATYVLGIGDRHPDNIMCRQNGVLFHIDFGHFLGNFKVKKVVANYSWKRERTPFVFLPAMKYVMKNENNNLYAQFEQWFADAYMALRIRHRLLFNLFLLMIPSQMPELICMNDLTYLRDQLHLTDIAQDKIHTHCKKMIKQCLADKSRVLDNIFHAVKHA